MHIAREVDAGAGELKAGPKTQKLPVQVAQCRKNLNWIVARSSHTCTMNINYHFDALLVLHTRTASVVGATEVQTQCRGAPTEFRYWSRGVCWRG